MTYKLEDEEPFQSFPKPGPKKRSSKIKNKSPRLHDIEKPKDTHCRFCNQPDDGTAFYHHTEDRYLKLKYGNGIGKKVDDRLSVWAHFTCGEEMSKKPYGKTDEEKLLWLNGWYLGIIETWLV